MWADTWNIYVSVSHPEHWSLHAGSLGALLVSWKRSRFLLWIHNHESQVWLNRWVEKKSLESDRRLSFKMYILAKKKTKLWPAWKCMEAPGGQRHISELPSDKAQQWKMTEMAAGKMSTNTKVQKSTETLDRYGLMLRIAFVSLGILGDKST